MNQREALVTIIEFLQEQPLETRELKRALKVIEKRSEVLRVRYERRRASPPDDISDEPLTIEKEVAVENFRRGACPICDGVKERDCWMCVKCFDALDPQLRKALQGFRCVHWLHAICRAIRVHRRPSVVQSDEAR